MKPFTYFFLSLGAAAQLASAATYHVRQGGDDTLDGTRPETAWGTISKVNKTSLRPGDRVLFQGGKSFAGNLVMGSDDAGQENAPVVIGSYGKERAILKAGLASGISLENAAHVTLENLVIEGGAGNQGWGVWCENSLADPKRLDGLTLENLEVSGFGRHGILVTGKSQGFRRVRIRGCSMHDNVRGGLEVAGRLSWEAREYAHEDVVVSRCLAYRNTGDPDYKANHSGSGLVLYQVDRGRIEQSAAWNNGENCPAKGGGPVGIWTCASRKVVIEHCESFANKSRGLDGGGFDVDGGSEECVLQNNYSHDNAGPGLMVYTYPYASYSDRGTIVRFNISVNDATGSDYYAGLWVRADGRKIKGLEIYNNTVITRGPQAAVVYGQDVEVLLRNNIFLCATNGTPLKVEDGHGGTKFENNLYWRNGSPFLVKWNGKAYPSLDLWNQESAQESAAGKRLGLFVDPGIAVVTGETIQPQDLKKLIAYRPANRRVLTSGMPPGTADELRDFFNTTLQGVGTLPIGAVAAPGR